MDDGHLNITTFETNKHLWEKFLQDGKVELKLYNLYVLWLQETYARMEYELVAIKNRFRSILFSLRNRIQDIQAVDRGKLTVAEIIALDKELEFLNEMRNILLEVDNQTENLTN